MIARRRQLAADLLARSRSHDREQSDRLERYRNLEPETAELLALLVRAARPRRSLEIGTSNGYSTLWLADAAEAVGGALTSVEIDPGRVAEARRHLDAAGLRADVRVEDAAATLAASPDAHWSFVFLDAERPAYSGYWPELLRCLVPGGLLAIDNVLSHAGEVEEITALIAAEPTVTSSLIPVGAGLRLAVTAP